MHRSLTVKRVAEAMERQFRSLDNPGFCTHCGEEATGCEPDAREYACEYCGRFTVYGAEELLMCVGVK